MLRSIGGEIGERIQSIERLESSLSSSSTSQRDTRKSTSVRVMEASLAHERRELRLAKQELARFGCTLQERRILIPGEDGTHEHGYAWSREDERLHAMSIELAA
jgi:hypothetical protein